MYNGMDISVNAYYLSCLAFNVYMAYKVITTKQHKGTENAKAILTLSAISPIKIGAIAPPTILIIKNEDAILVFVPALLSANAKIVGNMILSHR